MTQDRQCRVCKSITQTENSQKIHNETFINEIDCTLCGLYKGDLYNFDSHTIDSILKKGKDLQNKPFRYKEIDKNRLLLSHKIVHADKNIIWNFDRISHILVHDKLPDINEQLDLVLMWIGNKAGSAGKHLDLDINQIANFAGTGTGINTDNETNIDTDSVYSILEHLHDKQLINFSEHSGGGFAKITFNGWVKYNEITEGRQSYKRAFMAMKFGDPTLDRILNDHFRHGVEQTGFFLKRVDDEPQAGLIDIKMRQDIKTSRFVIADLTHDNLGAYWEAGYAEGLGKPVIYTCQKQKFDQAKTHFDVNHHLTILWDENNPEEAVEQLKAAIRYTIPEAIQLDTED